MHCMGGAGMSDITRSLWATRKAAGLCGNCGKVKPIEGRTLCRQCTDIIQYGQKKFRTIHALEICERKRQRYIKLKESGLCVKCGKVPPACGRVYCAECAAYTKAQSLKHRMKQKELSQKTTEGK